jgi:hypothetical protein
VSDSTVRHIGQRSLGASLQLPDSFKLVADVLGLPTIDLSKAHVSFSFHRERRDGVWGWATHLHLDRLCLHSPWADDLPFPRRRVDAERWVVAFCKKHGIVPMLNLRYDRRKHPGRPPPAPPPLRLVP